MDGAIRAIDAVMRETSLFAAAGFLIGGIDDLAVDILFVLRRCDPADAPRLRTVAGLSPAPAMSARFAIFVRGMGRSGCDRADAGDRHRRRWIIAITGSSSVSIPTTAQRSTPRRRVAERDPRIRLVIGGK